MTILDTLRVRLILVETVKGAWEDVCLSGYNRRFVYAH